jgi:hypothetical protein
MGERWKALRHRWKHWMGSNDCEVVTWWSRDDRVLMIGLVCNECGVVTGVHECAVRHPSEARP